MRKRKQIKGNHWNQFVDELLWFQLLKKIDTQICRQLRDQILDQIEGQLEEQVQDHVNAQIWNMRYL